MLKRWRKIKLTEFEFSQLIINSEVVLQRSNTVVFTPNNTGPNWLGIKNATINMFPNEYLLLPQSYSSSLLSKEQTIKFLSLLKEKGAQFIIFSGLPDYTLEWIQEVHKLDIKIGVIFHGGQSEFTNNSSKQKQMSQILSLVKKGVIVRVGVVKKGLKESLEHLTKIKIHKLTPVSIKSKDIEIKKFSDKKIHIGVFGNASFNKNRHTQVLAASLIENSQIHVISPNEFSYAVDNSRIITHNNLNKENFLKLLGSMDINLYVSYSESWGQVITESISMGVPCLASNNSGVFDSNETLKSALLVSDYDNPYEIAKKIKSVLRMNLKEEYEAFIESLNNEAKSLVQEFKNSRP
ncbi:MAG: hypothetical protein CMP67_04375 [Flavobacteriales bacterium]|nr:hypothetical protein [Flavobacteriales bacterium]|tara:strand:+ start:1273 stop:2325 length:1053 start_codon:yes stop_codon:yes gene_type:complete